MAYPTRVNSQITDAVSQQAVSVLGAAPTMAMASIYQSAAHSMSIAFENAVLAQRHASISAQASTNQGVIQVYGLGAAASAAATRAVRSDPAQNLLVALLIAKTFKLL